MTWTAKAIKTGMSGQQFEAIVAFTNDQDPTQSFQQSFVHDGSQASLEALCQARVSNFGKSSAITPGQALSLTPLVPPLPPAATPLQLWMVARENMRKCQRGLSEQIPKFDQARLDQAIKDRDALYDPSFEVEV